MATNLGTLTLNLIAQTGLFTQGLNRAEQQTRTSARNMSNELNLVGKSFKDLQGTLMASFAGALSIGAAISKMDAYTGLQNRLKLVTASQTELNNALKDTFNIAQATGQSWDSTAQVYQRFADNAKRLGITLGQTASLTETVAKAISISGASAASAEAALVQFGQALASGVLRGEEFNSISEQAPGLLKAIATGLNVNIGELRAMAAEGKLTADVVIKSLEKAKVSVDDLFNKTDFTIGNSFTMLNNALIQFVGEAGKANGAASFLSSTIKSLADNLGAIANVAVLGGVALLTKAIATQAIAVKEAIGASIARRAAQAAEAESVVRLATIETQRIRAQVGALASEQNLIVARLRSNVTLQERIVLEARATQVAIQLAVAERNLTAATVAQTAAQNALNTSRTIGARVFAALGGGVGVLTIAVTALAAGYMYMKHRAEEANKKLEEQMVIASKTREELLALKGVQKDVAVNDLKDAFEKQNVSLRKLNNEYLGFIDNIGRTSDQSNKVYEIFELARKGAITNTKALERLNKLNILTPDQKKQGLDLVNNYILQAQETLKAEKALNVFKVTVKLAGNAAQNAAIQQQKQADALNNTAAAADSAKKALSKLAEEKTDAQYILMTAKNLGGDIEKAKGLLAFRKNLGMGSTGGPLDPKKRAAFEASWAAQQQLKAYEESQRNLAKASSKAEKNHESVRQKASDNAIKLREKQFQDREDIYYKYASREMKIEKDLQNEIAKIQGSNFSPKDTAGYIDNARARGGLEIQLYQAQLDAELNDWKSTEQEKLNQKVYINEMMIQLDADMNDKQKKQAMQSLIDKSNYELAQIQLAKETRIFQAQQAMYSEIGLIQKRYELEQRKIIETAGIADDERRKQLDALNADMKQQEAEKTVSIMMNYKNAIGIDTSADAAFIERQKAINAAIESGFIKQKEYEKESLASRQQYDRDMQSSALSSLNTLLSATSSTWSNMTQLIKDGAGEQSGVYKAMFAMQQAFAMTSATVSAFLAYNQVLASPWNTDLISKSTAANIVLGMGMAGVGAIAAQTIQGMAHDGIDNIPKEGTWLLDKGERVVDSRTNADLKDYLANQNSGDINFTQTIVIQSDGSSKTNNSGEMKQLGGAIETAVVTILRRELRQGGIIRKAIGGA